MKRYIALFCTFTILLGSIANRWATVQATVPNLQQEMYYTISQPSGETFTAYTYDDTLKPPFPSGTHLTMTIPLREQKEEEIGERFFKRAFYTVYLSEDGYWYYPKCLAMIFPPKQEGDPPIVYKGEPTDQDIIWTDMKYIWEPAEPIARVMIDPLPEEVVPHESANPFTMCKTTRREKESMDKLIAAERERLALLQANTTSMEIKDPGPEAFIYETIETSDGSMSQTAEITSTIEAVVTTAEEEASSTGDASTASVASEPITTAQNQTKNRSWLSTCLIGGGIVVVLSGGIVTGLLIWRRRKNVVK